MSNLSKIMEKELRLSVASLIFMSLFTILTTTLYFQKRSVLSNAQVFEGEYTDMGFDILDSHTFIGTTDLSDIGYDQLDSYVVALNVKYRDKFNRRVQIKLNYEDIDLNEFADTIIYLEILNKDDKVIYQKNKLELKNETLVILDEPLSYSNENYQYKVCLNIYNKYNEVKPIQSYNLASKLSADLI